MKRAGKKKGWLTFGQTQSRLWLDIQRKGFPGFVQFGSCHCNHRRIIRAILKRRDVDFPSAFLFFEKQ
jgi:hypothetical protein